MIKKINFYDKNKVYDKNCLSIINYQLRGPRNTIIILS